MGCDQSKQCQVWVTRPCVSPSPVLAAWQACSGRSFWRGWLRRLINQLLLVRELKIPCRG